MPTTAELELDRYLVPFDLRRVPQYGFDVLVLGGGAGGSLAALAAADCGASVGLLSKAGLTETNTQYAQGGMAAVLDRADSFEVHVADTLRVGCGLAESPVVEEVVRGGPAAVERLLALGAEFDRTADGQLDLLREGGHTFPRIIHSRGAATGTEIQRKLSEAIQAHPRITTFPETFVVDLLSGTDGEIVGALSRSAREEYVAYAAPEVVLATGGAGQIYRETTNPEIATADGVAMAFRAGADVRDLEFIQFHPTCLYIAGAARVLISEVVRGAGGVLRDRHGVRFMPDAHPEAELAPRDVVSRAAFERMVATDDTSVYLDLSEIDRDPHRLFPRISHICRFFGIDIARDPIPVRPGAHYMIGGICVDLDGRTNVPGLWATGECASTGIHGANRMGSNSLLEAIVLGARVGEAAATAAASVGKSHLERVAERKFSNPPPDVKVNIDDMIYSLKSLMWRQMGVDRNGLGMRDALADIAFWMRATGALALEGRRSLELVNMLTVARLATIGALEREESRGVHYRSDYPGSDPAWRAHLRLRPYTGRAGLNAVELVRDPLAEAVTHG
ncbi:MAG: L-aspartate oxidase [bacterium]|nr:L-aspartate oxidase [bacterium]